MFEQLQTKNGREIQFLRLPCMHTALQSIQLSPNKLPLLFTTAVKVSSGNMMAHSYANGVQLSNLEAGFSIVAVTKKHKTVYCINKTTENMQINFSTARPYAEFDRLFA
jgi:hypothetical protein